MAPRSVTGEMAPADSPPQAGEMIITLTSLEGMEFRLTEAEARLSSHLASMIDNGGNVLALATNIPAHALDKVTKYCNKHAAAGNPSRSGAAATTSAAATARDLENWDRELVRELDDDVDALYDLVVAADFLRLNGLVDVVCEKVAGIIKRCDTPKEIRETFRIPDDLSAEQKEKIRNEYIWAFGPDDI
jgi:S-phase kinase-associated protein 1